MGKNEDALELAITEIAGYFGVAAKDSFMQDIAKTAQNAPALNNASKPSSDANESREIGPKVIKTLLNICDGGIFMSEMVRGNNLFAFQEDENQKEQLETLRNIITIIGASNVVPGTKALGHKIGEDESGMMHPYIDPKAYFGLTQATDSNVINTATMPTKQKPGISNIFVWPAKLNYGAKDTGAISIFMNGIPAIEWSRALPYVSIEVIQPGPSVTATGDDSVRARNISLTRFLMGKSSVTGVAKVVASAETYDIFTDNNNARQAAEAGKESSKRPKPFGSIKSSAGMEIFTSPQTLIPVDEPYHALDSVYYSVESSYVASRGGEGAIVGDRSKPDPPKRTVTGELKPQFPGEPGHKRAAPIIDRMRPFMTVKNFNVSVKPTRGMMTTKSASMQLTLHDKSRLSEIAPLTTPSQFGRTEILVEYGWSHPDGEINSPNAFGAFINSMRTKEKYRVVNTSYTFDDAGQIEITLKLITKGGNMIHFTDIGVDADLTAAWEATEKIIETIQTVRKNVFSREGFEDIVGKSVIANLSPSSVGDVFDAKKLKEITGFIGAAGGSGDQDVKKLIQALTKLKDNKTPLQKTMQSVINKKMNTLKNRRNKKVGYKPSKQGLGKCPPDIFYSPFDAKPWMKAPSSVKGRKFSATGTYASFARIMSLFVGVPIAQSGRFDEVQMYFYTFNNHSSYLANSNVGAFPIRLDGERGLGATYNRISQQNPQVTVGKFANFLVREFIHNQGSDVYGFSKLYGLEKGKNVLKKEYKKAPGKIKRVKDLALEDAYGKGSDLIFKLPRVRMVAECVPHRNSAPEDGQPPATNRTILRLHFIDECAAKFAGLQEIALSSRNSEIGSLSNQIKKTGGSKAKKKGKDFTDRSNFREEKIKILESTEFLELFDVYQGDDGVGYLGLKGGISRLKNFLKNSMPSITVGYSNSAIKSSNISTMHNSKNSTIHMLRAMKNNTSNNNAPAEIDRGLPLRMMPMQISMDSIGCPLLSHGQKFFIDLGTGTTADNIYAVSGMDHKLAPGEFSTSFKLIPLDAYGRYESLTGIVVKGLEELVHEIGWRPMPPPVPPKPKEKRPKEDSYVAQVVVTFSGERTTGTAKPKKPDYSALGPRFEAYKTDKKRYNESKNMTRIDATRLTGTGSIYMSVEWLWMNTTRSFQDKVLAAMFKRKMKQNSKKFAASIRRQSAGDASAMRAVRDTDSTMRMMIQASKASMINWAVNGSKPQALPGTSLGRGDYSKWMENKNKGRAYRGQMDKISSHEHRIKYTTAVMQSLYDDALTIWENAFNKIIKRLDKKAEKASAAAWKASKGTYRLVQERGGTYRYVVTPPADGSGPSKNRRVSVAKSKGWRKIAGYAG